MSFLSRTLSLLVKLVVIGVALVVIAGVVFYAHLNPSPPDKQAFVNGVVLTIDETDSIVEAVLVEGERIVAVGTNEEIRSQLDAGAEVVDLQGKTLMPGFIDAHGHFPGSGLSAVAVDLNSPPINKVKNIDQALALLKEKAEQAPEGKWIVGFGYDDTALEDKRHFNKQELDLVSNKHPIYILHISGHMGVGNSLALSLGNITAASPNPEGGEIIKDKAGETTGLLLETAHKPMAKLAFNFPLLDRLKITDAAVKDYLSKGVTTAQNGLAAVDHIKGLWQASQIGMVPLRLVLWPDEYVGEKLLAHELDYGNKKSDRFTIGAIKLVADGSIQGYTGFLKDPYFVQPKDSAGDYRGYPSLSESELVRQVSEYHKAGYQLAIHGNGDAAIEMIINAYEKAQAEHHRQDARPIIIHSQMITNEQLDRVKALGMTPSFFAAHTYYWGDRHKNIFLGSERANRISPTRTAQEKEIPFTVHMDTPVVPMDPMLIIWNAANRETSSGNVLGKGERISINQALRATTINAAWQVFQEGNRGSIEVGKFADLVILSENPLSEAVDIRNIKVEKTYIGGVAVYP